MSRALLRAVVSSLRGGSLLHAQAVAFLMFVAFFPALIFLAGVVALVAPGWEDLLQDFRLVLPPGSRRAVVDSLLQISGRSSELLLAGALGTPVWTALPIVPDWRWMLARSDTPWYPTMRLFRQARGGDWSELFHRMAEALASQVAAGDRSRSWN